MSQPTLNFVTCPDAAGGHRMAYWEWGNPHSSHVVVCAHGLTRQGRDFDVLARALCQQSGNSLRVVCPDVAGRGQSDWLKDPMAYQVPYYGADMLALLAQLKPATLDWVGTSMGGLIGMVVCNLLTSAAAPGHAAPEGVRVGASIPPVRRLILNDVGPTIEWQALQRIGEYLGNFGTFESVPAAADAMWAMSSSFGPHTPEQWLALSQHMVKPVPGSTGQVTLHYDPAIAMAFKTLTAESSAQSEALLWQLYDNIRAQTLLVRGAVSDLLSLDTAHAMTQRGPKAQLVEFAGVGHAPTFNAEDQVRTATHFLLG